jgi:hypothetical protein
MQVEGAVEREDDGVIVVRVGASDAPAADQVAGGSTPHGCWGRVPREKNDWTVLVCMNPLGWSMLERRPDWLRAMCGAHLSGSARCGVEEALFRGSIGAFRSERS